MRGAATATEPVFRKGPAAGRRGVSPAMYFFVGWLVLVILAALFGPYFLSDEALKQSLVQRLLPPSFDHPLGTDAVGRDILTRVIAGSQPTLAIAVGGVLVGLAIGMIAGTLAGYFGGIVNRVVMALVDIKLAFPTIIFAIGIIAVFGTSTPILIMVIGLTGWVTFARVQRAVVLKLKAQPFVEAAGSIGASHLRIIALHIVPNSLSPMLVMTSLDLVRIILLEASLSFLGLGVQPPTPSWGGMINAGRDYIQTAWWIALAPGAAIMLTALSVSRVGDWLRDVLDPDLG